MYARIFLKMFKKMKKSLELEIETSRLFFIQFLLIYIFSNQGICLALTYGKVLRHLS